MAEPAGRLAAKRYQQAALDTKLIRMRTLFLLTLCLTFCSLTSQNLISDRDTVWKDNNGTYDYFEYVTEANQDKFYTDTIYSIQLFPKKNDWKVYYDASKTNVATLIHYDQEKKTINTKHFNRRGQLIKELEASYRSSKKYNPWTVDAKNVIYLKAYRQDSLIYEIKGYGTSLIYTYKNPFTKRHFVKKIFYKDGDYHSEVTGETTWEYHENGVVKSICAGHIEEEKDESGNTYFIMVSKCDEFDKNGCLIRETSK